MRIESPNEDRLWAIVVVDQQRITALDTVAVAIRGWTITLDSALVGIAVTTNRRSLVLVAIVVTALFAMLDLRYRSGQLAHADRSTEIERLIVPQYEYSRYRRRLTWRFISRVSGNRYATVFTFYSSLLTLLVLVLVALGSAAK